jgi:hypothetical protein
LRYCWNEGNHLLQNLVDSGRSGRAVHDKAEQLHAEPVGVQRYVLEADYINASTYTDNAVICQQVEHANVSNANFINKRTYSDISAAEFHIHLHKSEQRN